MTNYLNNSKLKMIDTSLISMHAYLYLLIDFAYDYLYLSIMMSPVFYIQNT